MTDFQECLMHKDINTLYSLMHCLHHLHERMKDDALTMRAYMKSLSPALYRECDVCRENVAEETVMEMLTMTEMAINRRETMLRGQVDD